jgi:hypothetical protein
MFGVGRFYLRRSKTQKYSRNYCTRSQCENGQRYKITLPMDVEKRMRKSINQYFTCGKEAAENLLVKN